MRVMSFKEEKGLATFQGRLARFCFTFEGYLESAIKSLGFILCISFKNLVFTKCPDPKVIWQMTKIFLQSLLGLAYRRQDANP